MKCFSFSDEGTLRSMLGDNEGIRRMPRDVGQCSRKTLGDINCLLVTRGCWEACWGKLQVLKKIVMMCSVVMFGVIKV